MKVTTDIRPPGSNIRDRFLKSGYGLLLCCAVFLSSCAIGPNYKRPETNPPPAFRNETESTTNSLGDLPWWELFKDENLQHLLQTALTNNYDLRVAAARVEQAHAIADLGRTGLFPQLNYEASASRGKNAVNGNAEATGRTASSYRVLGTVSWEIDLWGRIRRLNESAQAQYLASRETQNAVLISLISQVAQAYFELLALDAQLQIAGEATNAFGQSYKIFNDRLQHGVASRLETSAAEAALATAAATIPDLERRIALQENQINVLLGRYTGPVSRDLTQLKNFQAPDIPPGLPSSLLERRPDIRAAEQQLRSANAQVGAAIADFFPRLELTALLGQVSPELSALTGGGANAWSVGANLMGPIFQGGRLSAQYRQAKAVKKEFLLEYEAAVLNGFRDVSDALISRQKFAEAQAQLERSVTAYETAVKVANERYVLGQSSYYEVLLEQQLLYPAENSLVQSRLNQLLATVQLYRALGGGWGSFVDNQ